MTETTSIEEIGTHHYLGNSGEENGIIYSRRGGFIDVAHLRDQAVRDIWWTRERKLPSSKVLIQCQLQVYSCLQPWLVPGWIGKNKEPFELKVPEYTSDGQTLNSFYHLEFKLNYKFPFHKMFPERRDRNITQNDFDRLLAQVAKELTKKDSQFRQC